MFSLCFSAFLGQGKDSGTQLERIWAGMVFLPFFISVVSGSSGQGDDTGIVMSKEEREVLFVLSDSLGAD